MQRAGAYVASSALSPPRPCPDVTPARRIQGLSEGDVQQLQDALDAVVQENLGMAMIYTLVTAAQEWVTARAAESGGPTLDPVAEQRRMLEAEEARLAALRAHGTPVTPEAFKEWRARFDTEQALERAQLAGAGPAADGAAAAPGVTPRLTGKQWFLKQDAEHREVEVSGEWWWWGEWRSPPASAHILRRAASAP